MGIKGKSRDIITDVLGYETLVVLRNTF